MVITKLFQNRLNMFMVITLLFGIFGTFTQCTSHTQGVYADPKTEEIVGEQWNETDAQKLATEVVKKCLAAAWTSQYQRKNEGKKPIVIVAHIENKTQEHIDTEAITNEIRTELVNSGRVRFLANELRDQILKEYEYQKSGVVRADQAKGPGNQLGADFIMSGSLSAVVAEDGDYKTVTYQPNLQMIELSTSEVVWTYTSRIKKQFHRNSVTW